MNKMLAKFLLFFCCLTILGLAACKSAEARKDSNKNPAATSNDSQSSQAFMWNGQGVESFRPSVSNEGDLDELILALSSCDCAPRKTTSIMLKRANARGVLPQVLVPQIRESIASDSSLKLLASFPPMLGESLKSWFASDEKIANQIRKSVGEKLQASLASTGGTSLASRAGFRMDLFVPENSGYSFEVSKQAVYWNLTAARFEVWKGLTPLDGIDHGLQLLENLRMAAEWTYMFGLGSDGKPNGFGGLVLDTMTGNGALAKPIDPSVAPQGSGLFATGRFSIYYPSSTSVNMATQVKEQWQFSTDETPLLVQARIWRAAALAFRNFRFDTSKNSRNILMASNGALSQSVQKLPLVWLNGMSELLTKRFINESNHNIVKTAYGSSNLAELEELLALAQAANEWRLATTNISASGLDSSLQSKLQSVPEKMMQVVQLSVQGIISKYTYQEKSEKSKIYVGVNNVPANPKTSARVIALLASLENNGLQSNQLREIVLALFSSHAALWSSSSDFKNADADTVIYASLAANQMAVYKTLPEWSETIRGQLSKALKDWDR